MDGFNAQLADNLKPVPFAELAKINVNDRVEKKGKLSYLSWAWAVDQLLRLDDTANWCYPEPQQWGETWMVFCQVTAFGKTRQAQLPVMDHHNKAIKNPDAFAVNTAMQRCLAKAISLHGIGLYIYAGEDLPPSDEPAGTPWTDELTTEAETAVGKGLAAYKEWFSKLSEATRSVLVQTEEHKKFKERASH